MTANPNTNPSACSECNLPDGPNLRPGTADSDINVLAPPFCPLCGRNQWGNTRQMPNTNPNKTDDSTSEAPQAFKDAVAKAAEASMTGAWSQADWDQWLKTVHAMIGDVDGTDSDE